MGPLRDRDQDGLRALLNPALPGRFARTAWHRVRRRLDGDRWEFSIAIYEGTSPTALRPMPGVRNPVLSRHDVTDRNAAFVADPFMVNVEGIWYLFFEVLNRETDRGEIALATSPDLRRWRYEGVVLSEPFHLSYPLIVVSDGVHYMIPESYQAQGANLYRASYFPRGWQRIAPLLHGPVILDSTIFQHNGRWWMFCDTSPHHTEGELRLFYSDSLHGPWIAHARNPLIKNDPNSARPAGRVVTMDDKLIRFGQVCRPEYGTAVRAFEIVRLTTDEYEEREIVGGPVLKAGWRRWHRHGMHHVDAHETSPGHWVACVDGR